MSLTNILEISEPECLLQAVDTHGRTPLHFAMHTNQIQCAKLLLDAGAEVEKPDQSNQSTPLHIAVRAGHPEATRFIIKNGTARNCVNKHTNYQIAVMVSILRFQLIELKNYC